MRRALSFILLTALPLTACQVDRRDPVTQHAGKVEQGPNTPVLPAGQIDPFTEFAKRLDQPSTDLIAEVLNPLANHFFSPSRLTHPEFQTDPMQRRGLYVFNRALLSALSKPALQKPAEAVLQRYIEVLRFGCTPNTWNQCHYLQFFAQDALTAAVVKQIIHRQAGARQKYLWYQLSYDFGNHQPDPDLSAAILTDAMAIYQDLLKSSPAELNRFSQILAIELEQSRSRELPNSFVEQLGDWYEKLSSGEVELRLGKRFESALTVLITANLHQKSLWKKFSDSGDFNTGGEEDFPSGYMSSLNWIHKEAGPQFLQEFGVDSLSAEKIRGDKSQFLSFFVADQVMKLRSIDRIRPFWQASDRDPLKALSMLESMTKTFFVRNMLMTHKKLASQFRLRLKEGLPRNKLIEQIVLDGNAFVAPIWKDYSARLRHVKSFFESEIETHHLNSANEEIRNRVKDFRRMLDEIPSNIQYMVTYPSMLMLGYYAIIWDYSEVVALPWGGSVRLDKYYLAHELLAGSIPMFFRFTEDSDGLRRFSANKTLWSIYWVARSGLLKQYGISQDDWVLTFFRGFLNDNMQILRNWIKRFDQLQKPGAAFQDYLAVCHGRGSSQKLNLGDLKDGLAFGLPGAYSRAPLSEVGTFYYETIKQSLKNSMSEAYEYVRADIDPHLRSLSLLSHIVGADAGDKKSAKPSALDQLVNEMLGLRNQVLAQADRSMDAMAPCHLQFIKIEKERRRHIVDREVDFLNQVTKELAELNAKDGANQEEANQRLAKLAGLSDIFAVNREYAEEYARIGGIQRDADGRYYFNYRVTDLMLRMAAWINSSYSNGQVDRVATQVVIPRSLRELRKSLMVWSPEVDTGTPLYGAAKAGQQDGFQLLAMQKFKEQVRWVGDFRSFAFWARSFLLNHSAQFKMRFAREVDIKALSRCDLDCQENKMREMQVQLAPLFALNSQLLKYFNIAEAPEAKWLKLFNQDSFQNTDNDLYTPKGPANLFIDGSYPNSYIGLADDLFTYITSARLGSFPIFHEIRPLAEEFWLVDRPDPRGENNDAKDLIVRNDPYGLWEDDRESARSIVQSKQQLVFPIAEESLQLMKIIQTYQVSTDMMISQAFFDKIAKLPAPKGPVRFSYLVDTLEHPSWLTPNLRAQYLVVLRRFNQETLGAYLPEALLNHPSWKF